MDQKKMKRTIEKIAQNYTGIEKSLVTQLQLEAPNHPPTIGSYRETVWNNLFEMIIPKKYCIEQGVFIIDAYGGISREADLVVFDETYTPYIFNYGTIKFIPIEAVSIVIQCKSDVKGKMIGEDKNRKTIYQSLEEWVESIDQLKTSLDSVARLATDVVDNFNVSEQMLGKMTQTATRPIKILCALSITEELKDELKKKFDMLLYIQKNKFVKLIEYGDSDFVEWNDALNHFGYERYSEEEKAYRSKCKKSLDTRESLKERKLGQLSVTQKVRGGKIEENIIMSLTFQLNQLLMLINNPMLFPHRAYAKEFTEILGGKVEEESK